MRGQATKLPSAESQRVKLSRGRDHGSPREPKKVLKQTRTTGSAPKKVFPNAVLRDAMRVSSTSSGVGPSAGKRNEPSETHPLGKHSGSSRNHRGRAPEVTKSEPSTRMRGRTGAYIYRTLLFVLIISFIIAVLARILVGHGLGPEVTEAATEAGGKTTRLQRRTTRQTAEKAVETTPETGRGTTRARATATEIEEKPPKPERRTRRPIDSTTEPEKVYTDQREETTKLETTTTKPERETAGKKEEITDSARQSSEPAHIVTNQAHHTPGPGVNTIQPWQITTPSAKSSAKLAVITSSVAPWGKTTEAPEKATARVETTDRGVETPVPKKRTPKPQGGPTISTTLFTEEPYTADEIAKIIDAAVHSCFRKASQELKGGYFSVDRASQVHSAGGFANVTLMQVSTPARHNETILVYDDSRSLRVWFDMRRFEFEGLHPKSNASGTLMCSIDVHVKVTVWLPRTRSDRIYLSRSEIVGNEPLRCINYNNVSDPVKKKKALEILEGALIAYIEEYISEFYEIRMDRCMDEAQESARTMGAIGGRRRTGRLTSGNKRERKVSRSYPHFGNIGDPHRSRTI